MSLEKARVFQGISKETMAKISAAAVEESHPQGSFLFRRGNPALYFYILKAGRIRLSVGTTGLLARIYGEPGDPFGWSSMTERETYVASAECVSPVQVIKIDRTRLNQVLDQDPVSGMQFLRHLAAMIGDRLVNSYEAALSLQGDRDLRSYG